MISRTGARDKDAFLSISAVEPPPLRLCLAAHLSRAWISHAFIMAHSTFDQQGPAEKRKGKEGQTDGRAGGLAERQTGAASTHVPEDTAQRALEGREQTGL